MTKSIYIFLFLITTLFINVNSAFSQESQIYINEICASNVSIKKSPNLDIFSDWIEIYNSSSSAVDLSGYFISDNLKNPTKDTIPHGITIGAKSYLLLWADGNNSETHLNFKLDKGGETLGLYSPEKAIIDSIVYGPQLDDVSYGRLLENISQWEYFEPSSPGEQNNTSNIKAISPTPLFSIEGGFFEGNQILSFLNSDQTEIYYTYDGTLPNENSAHYSTPLNINTTTAVRAISYSENSVPSTIITNTFFIDEAINLPIISLVTDPANFFDDEIGIYVTGTNGTGGYCDNNISNVKQDWERPVNIEFYEIDGKQGLNQGAGIKIFGGCSRHRFPQRSLALYARNSYGKGSFKHQLFPEKQNDNFESFILRSSADDQQYTLFRDALAQQVLIENMDLDYQAYRPAMVFLNGAYWGIHNIREKLNEHYVADNYGIDPDEVNLLERNGDIAFGSNAGYNEMVDFANSNDLAVQANYDQVAMQIDINQFIDYQIGHIYLAERDWPGNNIKFWRANSGRYSKWRWINYDMDQTFTTTWTAENMIRKTTNAFGSSWPNPEWSTRLFRNLLDNDEFKNEFIQRYAYHMNTTFKPERLIGFIDDLQTALEPEMPRHIEKWGGQLDPDFGENWQPQPTFNSIELWKENIEQMRIFAVERPAYTLQNFIAYFGLSGSSHISINSNITEAGLFSINNKVIEEGFNGTYFNDIPTKITADPFIAYSFSHWEIETALIESSILINQGSTWKYLDNGVDLGTNWVHVSFDDSDWQSGPAQLGYGDNDEATLISYGPDSNNKYITTYFRKSFEIEDSSKVLSLSISVLVDDGAVVYLNGNEIVRINMPDGEINFETTAPGYINNEDSFSNFTVPLEFLKNELNTIAVEVHQSDGSSSDVSFDCSLSSTYKAHTEITTNDSPTLVETFNGNATYTAYFVSDSTNVANPIIISEINYNSSPDYDSNDWIEIYNNSGKVIDMNGWQLSDESDQAYHFPEGLLFKQEEYLVICKDIDKMQNNYPWVENVLGEFNFGLSKEGELISIRDNQNLVIEQVAYKNTSPWPISAIGTGYTIELQKISLDNNDGANWISNIIYGTPGKATDYKLGVDEILLSDEFKLYQNYPNPFSTSTSIRFSLPETENISLKVYDLTGRELKNTQISTLPAGDHTIQFNSDKLSNGVYFYRLTAGTRLVGSKRMLLIK